MIGDASFAPGLVDEAFSLDGDGDWVDLGNNPIYNFGSSDFTISLWAYWNTLAGEQILIEKWDDGPAFEGVEEAGWTLVKMANNVLRFATGQGGSSGIDLDGTPAGIAPAGLGIMSPCLGRVA